MSRILRVAHLPSMRVHFSPTKDGNFEKREGPRALKTDESALLDVLLDLALYALQRVVDRLHSALQRLGDVLIALPLEIELEHLRLEVRQDLAERRFHALHLLARD